LTSVIDLIDFKKHEVQTACTKARTHFFPHLMPQIHCCASQLALFGKLLVPQPAKKYKKNVKCWHRYYDFLQIIWQIIRIFVNSKEHNNDVNIRQQALANKSIYSQCWRPVL